MGMFLISKKSGVPLVVEFAQNRGDNAVFPAVPYFDTVHVRLLAVKTRRPAPEAAVGLFVP
jgi:hypothetical protein